jgi:type VI protein secretion system component VasF
MLGGRMTTIENAISEMRTLLGDLHGRLSKMEGGEEERAHWREAVDKTLTSVDDKLDLIANAVNASKQDQAPRVWWAAMLSRENLPLIGMVLVLVAVLALLWNVILGDSSIDGHIDHIRGKAGQHQAG